MKDGTLTNWTTVANWSLFTAGALCVLLGLVCYLSFGSYTKADVLTNFGDNDQLILVARLLLAITMVFTYPMEMFVARHALISMFRECFSKDKDAYSAGESPGGQSGSNINSITNTSAHSISLESRGTSFAGGMVMTDFKTTSGGLTVNSSSKAEGAVASNAGKTDQASGEEKHSVSLVVHAGVTLTLWGIVLAIALASANLKIVLGLTGSLAASMLGFIMPAVLYLKTYESEFTQYLYTFNKASATYQPLSYVHVMSGKRFLWAVFMAFFGLVAMFTGVGSVFYELAS